MFLCPERFHPLWHLTWHSNALASPYFSTTLKPHALFFSLPPKWKISDLHRRRSIDIGGGFRVTTLQISCMQHIYKQRHRFGTEGSYFKFTFKHKSFGVQCKQNLVSLRFGKLCIKPSQIPWAKINDAA